MLPAVFLVGSDIVVGTPPTPRSGCGFTAVGSRIFVFAGESALPSLLDSGEEFAVFIHIFVDILCLAQVGCLF